MTAASEKAYPGELATLQDLQCLAEEYRKAALLLLQQRRRGDPLSLAPCRLAAIHAVELYLNLLLLHVGHDAAYVRGLKHDLGIRTELAIKNGLKLRQRTVVHIATMAGNREYLINRYAPELAATVSQINRLIATLDEVAKKVNLIIGEER